MINLVFQNGAVAEFQNIQEFTNKGNDYMFDAIGQLYALKGSNADIRKRISDRKALYSRWLDNLDKIDEELQMLEMLENKASFKKMLASMSPEEREEYLKGIA